MKQAKSRNEVATVLGINESRLRQNEENGTFPEWGTVTGDQYYEVVAMWQALRRAGWTNLRVRRAFSYFNVGGFGNATS